MCFTTIAHWKQREGCWFIPTFIWQQVARLKTFACRNEMKSSSMSTKTRHEADGWLCYLSDNCPSLNWIVDPFFYNALYEYDICLSAVHCHHQPLSASVCRALTRFLPALSPSRCWRLWMVCGPCLLPSPLPPSMMISTSQGVWEVTADSWAPRSI